MSMKPREVQELITKSLMSVIHEGQVFEIRILDNKRLVSGYFDYEHIGQAAAAVVPYDGRVSGIYWTLNPVMPALISRAYNRLKERAKVTTSDDQILRRVWLPIDIDAERPSGISSSDDEHNAALAKAGDIRSFLTDLGFPQPISADSGNGAHLLYRIDLPNDDDSARLVEQCLKALAQKFDDSSTTVDTSNYNASRIFKLYGTLARKGDNTPDRPHRRAQILDAPASRPEDMGIVSAEQLRSLAALYKPETPSTHHTSQIQKFDLQEWINKYGLDVSSPKPYKGGRIWIFNECPFNPDHNRGEAFIIEGTDGKIGAGCHHKSCTWDWHDLRRMVEGKTSTKAISQPAVGGRPSKKEIYNQVAQDLMGTYVFKTFLDDNSIWWYDPSEGIYRPYGDRIIHDYCVRLGEGEHFYREVAFRIRGFTHTDRSEVNKNKYLVHLNNCILNLETMTVRDFSPDVIALSKIPVDYQPGAVPKRFLEFLADITPDDNHQTEYLIQEIFGYCLYPGYPFQYGFMFVGEGRNGKGTLLTVLSRMLGEQNVAAKAPHDFRNNTDFGSLYQKKANIVGEVPATELRDTSVFKALTGGDLVEGKFLYRDPFFFRNEAKFIMAMNTVPRFSEDSFGLWRRLVVVPFERIVTNEIRNLADELTTPEMLSGILNWALVGLKRLLKNKQFTYSPPVQATRDKYEILMDPVGSFVDRCLVLDEDGVGEYGKTEIYYAYSIFCRYYKVSRIGPAHFFKSLKKHIPYHEHRIRVKDGRRTIISGILLYDPSSGKDVYPGTVIGQFFKKVVWLTPDDPMLEEFGLSIFDEGGIKKLESFEEV